MTNFSEEKRLPSSKTILEPSPFSIFLKRAVPHLGLTFGGGVLLLIFVIAIFAPILAPHDPYEFDLGKKFLDPVWHETGSWEHPFGTDLQGRDYLSRMIYGAQLSLLIGFASMLISGIIGTGLGVAAGEISGGIEIIGAGQGFTTPPFPEVGSLESRGQFFYFLSFIVLVLTFVAVKSVYSTRFRLVLNAIRDNEDKAEAMGIQTMKYKIIGWMISAFFCGLAGGIMGGLVGYIDSTDVAFDGREMGVFMVLMAILGGKGTLWGPVIGATLFHIQKKPIFRKECQCIACVFSVLERRTGYFSKVSRLSCKPL